MIPDRDLIQSLQADLRARARELDWDDTFEDTPAALREMFPDAKRLLAALDAEDWDAAAKELIWAIIDVAFQQNLSIWETMSAEIERKRAYGRNRSAGRKALGNRQRFIADAEAELGKGTTDETIRDWIYSNRHVRYKPSEIGLSRRGMRKRGVEG